jgi:hypothetical protein
MAKRLGSLTFFISCSVPLFVCAAEPTQVTTSALEFGGSLGRLLWVSVADRRAASAADGDRYTKLAAVVREQIDLGRASSTLLKSDFDLIAAATAYIAALDPEPLSNAITGVAAWGAKETGDAIGNAILGAFQEKARAILAEGLKESGISAAEIQNMSPSDLQSRVADLQIGGNKLRDLLHDDPAALSMLQAASIDLTMNATVANLAATQGIGTDVTSIKADLKETTENLTQYQTTVENHLSNVKDGLTQLQNDAMTANTKLSDLQRAVLQDSALAQTLTTISYSGWTTSQKLQAVQAGLFPNLTDASKSALVASLKAQQSVETTVNDLQMASQDFGNLAQIAGNVGLPPDLVKGFEAGQAVTSSIAKFATGDYLGAVAGLSVRLRIV